MNILYITSLDGKPWIGPTYSVPSQIFAQSQVDNVFWLNICDYEIEAGKKSIEQWKKLDYYHDLSEEGIDPVKPLTSLPFRADLIIVEQCYPFIRKKIVTDLIDLKIPYIIVPRGEFTRLAQRKKRIKKMIGNIIFRVKKFTKKALALQLLTEQEANETPISWNKKRIIVPNGVDLVEGLLQKPNNNTINVVYVGRFEPYQKGLDLLVEAISIIRNELLLNGVVFDLYGSDFENKRAVLEEMCKQKKLEKIVFFHDAVFGKSKSDVLKKADAFVMTSRFEGHPTGLLEALSYGLPCVVTTGANMRKEIENSNAGWGADNNSSDIASALIKMIEDKDSLGEKSQNAIRLASVFSWDSIGKKSHEIYKGLLKE